MNTSAHDSAAAREFTTIYDTWTDTAINIEIAMRKNMTFRATPEGVEILTPFGTWVFVDWVNNANDTLKLIDGFWVELGQQQFGDHLKLATFSTRIMERLTGYDKHSHTRCMAIAWLLWNDNERK